MPSDAPISLFIERAASHQQRAAQWLRRARDPTIGAVRPSQRRSMVLRALEHMTDARRQLEQAQQRAHTTELRDLLVQHLQQLDAAMDQAADQAHGLHERALGE
jgi:hypothetical protein